MGAPWDEEGRGRQKVETSFSSQPDITKNGRQVNIRLRGRIETKNLQGGQSEVKEKLGENTDLDPRLSFFPGSYEGKTMSWASYFDFRSSFSQSCFHLLKFL